MKGPVRSSGNLYPYPEFCLKLTIHRGADEVGGNCVEVTHKETRLVLDLGLPLFDKDRNASDSFRFRRMSVEELNEEGLLPPVEGLFEIDSKPRSEVNNEGRPDAILLSHAHMDHTGLVDFSHPDIPIYASRGTSKMMLAGKIFSRQAELPRERYRPLEPEKPVRIGQITVTAYGVDHSIHGAMGILLEADGETLFYTGDLRMHGLRGLEMAKLIFCLRSKQIDTLLIEGTHLGLPASETRPEREVELEIDQLVAEADDLVLACLSPMHLDRLHAFYQAARNAGRVFAVDLYTAFVMHLNASDSDLPRPTLENGVQVFLPQSMTGGKRIHQHGKLIDLYKKNPISIQEILAEPSKYVCTFRESLLRQDFQGKLPDGTLCLYAQWPGYLEEESWKPVQAALGKAQGQLVVVHTTGHLLREDIFVLIRVIDAKKIVPIHTFEPKKMLEITKLVQQFTLPNFLTLCLKYNIQERIYPLAPPDPVADAHYESDLGAINWQCDDTFRDDDLHYTPHEEFLLQQEEFLRPQPEWPAAYGRGKRFYCPAFNLFPLQRLLFDWRQQPWLSKA